MVLFSFLITSVIVGLASRFRLSLAYFGYSRHRITHAPHNVSIIEMALISWSRAPLISLISSYVKRDHPIFLQESFILLPEPPFERDFLRFSIMALNFRRCAEHCSRCFRIAFVADIGSSWDPRIERSAILIVSIKVSSRSKSD